MWLCVLTVNASSETSKPKPKPKSRGVYVPVVDHYMLGSTDAADAMSFMEHVACAYPTADGTICGGRLHDIRMPNAGTGGEFCFKIFCRKCGKEHTWGRSMAPERGKNGRFDCL